MNGVVEEKQIQKNSGEILCTITNQINEDISVRKVNSKCESAPEAILQSPMVNELSSTKNESLNEDGSCTNQMDKCSLVSDSGDIIKDQTVASDNANANEEIMDCVEMMTEKSSEEMRQNSDSGVDIEKCSESASNLSVSTTVSNFGNESDTRKEIIPAQSDDIVACTNKSNNASEICLNIKSNDEISITELVPASSETLEVLDESLSEEEVYVEVDDEESDLSGEKSEESQEGKDIKSCSMCEDVSNRMETSDSLNENNRNENDISVNENLPTGNKSEEVISESEVFEEVNSLSGKDINFEISKEKQDESLVEENSKIVCSLEVKSSQSESKSEGSRQENNQVQGEISKNASENDNVVSEIMDMILIESSVIVDKNSLRTKSLQSDSKSEVSSNENKSEVKKNVSENDNGVSEITDMKSLDSDIAVEKNSLQNVSVISEITDVKVLEPNSLIEENSSQNTSDLESNENVKINTADDFVVLSDVEWSDSDVNDKHKTIEEQDIKKDKIILNENKCSKKEESQKDVMNKNHSPSSDGDDFNLDDEVIEEFANEENKNMKLSDDELDDLVEEFVEAECSSPPAVNKESESKVLSSESDDEMELLIEDFKAVDSDNDCFIVQDSNNVVVINDDNKGVQPKKKKSNSNELQSVTDINSNKLSDNKVKNDAVSCSQELIKKPETSAEVSKNENIMEIENEIEILNDEANTEKVKNVKIGYFKSEIFDNEVEGNNQNNSNKRDSDDITNMKNKKSVNVITASPLFESLRGKVDLECRTDGIYLKKDKNINLQCANTNDEKENVSNNADISNKVSSGYDILSEDKSVINKASSNSLEEEQCMDDMLNKVCSSSDNNSTNNGECKSIAFKKKSDLVNNSILLEEKQIISQKGNIKPLGSLCNDVLEESKKRKLEALDDESDDRESLKKMKTLIKAESVGVTAESSSSQIDASLRKKILDHFNEAFPTKVQLKKSWLEKMSKRLCRETLLEEHKEEIAKQENVIKDLEDKLQSLKDDLQYSQSKASDFTNIQQALFKKHQFAAQECDVPQTEPLPRPFPSVTKSEVFSITKTEVLSITQTQVTAITKTEVSAITKTEVPAITKAEVPAITTEVRSALISSPAAVKTQVPQLKNSVSPVHQAAVFQKVTTTRLPVPKTVRFTPVPPNAVVTKKDAVPSLINSQLVPPRPAFAQKGQTPTKSCSQVIDLTDEESSSKKLMPASSTLVSLASNSKVNLPGLQNNQNVLLPINGLFQMLPAAAQNNSQFSISNPVQVQQVTRQAIVPTLAPNLLGPRTVAYIIPTNSGQISTIGRNSLPVSNFVPGSNQRLQTLIVRVTNPGQVPPISTAINSHARMPVPSQGLRIQSTRQPSIPSGSSDLVLFPRQPKHPAPFPALPEYRSSPQLKALPPKPSLKGSRAPNGIILSWNMSLLNFHAEIANYQLFAYQEQPGPVNSSLWKKVGDVKALPLPMACTLTQFMDGNRYYFTVRAVDVHNRFGPYSDAVSILFTNIKDCKSLK